jgi:hypothetical protein
MKRGVVHLSRHMTFALQLSNPVGQSVTVTYATKNDTALAGYDYTTTSGAVTFLPGETAKSVAVPIMGDAASESASESFLVNLVAPAVDIADTQAIGTIVDNDAVSSLFNYANFNSSSGLTLVGSASVVSAKRGANSVLRLTPAQANKAGAGWYTSQVDVADGFQTTFQFLMSGGSDGLAFVIQNAPTRVGTVGAAGGGIGYHGIQNSLAVEFDTWLNAASDWGPGGVADPNDNHVSVQTAGLNANSADHRFSLAYGTPGFVLDNNVVHTAMVQYVAGVLQVYVDSTATPLVNVAVDLASTLNLEALHRWQTLGANTDRLSGTELRIADLAGTTLGLASGNTIYLDVNAAGWGWFVDATPQDDSEFRKPGNQGEQDRIDLLTVVMHEVGHLLRYDHQERGVMAETLAAGVRRTRSPLDHVATVDQVFAQTGDHRAEEWPGGWLFGQLDPIRPWAKRHR